MTALTPVRFSAWEVVFELDLSDDQVNCDDVSHPTREVETVLLLPMHIYNLENDARQADELSHPVIL
jgi:hypothetical protein